MAMSFYLSLIIAWCIKATVAVEVFELEQYH